MSVDQKILDKAKYWATSSTFDKTMQNEIKTLIDQNDEKALVERFYRDLEFGTGGLRGILGAGTNRMNIYNVRKASIALSRYLKDLHGDKPLQIAITHDSRHFSRDFAKAAAEVFAAHDIGVVITKELRPVPMVSFMVRHYGCDAGVCVTASHNPPEYNGYKVYWNTGGQLVPPHDKKIIEKYLDIKGYDDAPRIPYDEAKQITEVGDELDKAYFAKVKSLQLRRDGRDGFKIVYSPLHGAGLYPVTEMLKQFGFNNVIVVPEQQEPDGDFPTVKSPNPENPAALDLALELGKKEKADLVIATDPDCDRIGMYLREGDNYFLPNGNQIGCILVEYVLSSLKELGRMPKNPVIIKTIVTTELQRDIAEHYGVACDDTLTGFKWICQRIEDYETGAATPYKKFVCGGEESYGFVQESFVRDKDGVIACTTTAEMLAHYKSKGMTISQLLDKLFRRHGVYHESLYNLVLPGKEGAEKIQGMMKKLREHTPTVIDGNNVKIFRDFQIGQEFETSAEGYKKVNDLDIPESNVLQFILDDGSKISVRPSGTEPKIKFYISVKNRAGVGASDKDLQAIKDKCRAQVKKLEEAFVAMSK